MSTRYYLVNMNEFAQCKHKIFQIKQFVKMVENGLKQHNIEYNMLTIVDLKNDLLYELNEPEEIDICKTSFASVDMNNVDNGDNSDEGLIEQGQPLVKWFKDESYVREMVSKGYAIYDAEDKFHSVDDFFEKMKDRVVTK